METRSEACCLLVAEALETFLVEWKPLWGARRTFGLWPLETFLVEWKLGPGPARGGA